MNYIKNSYEKFVKKELIYNSLNDILEKDFNKADAILDFLKQL